MRTHCASTRLLIRQLGANLRRATYRCVWPEAALNSHASASPAVLNGTASHFLPIVQIGSAPRSGRVDEDRAWGRPRRPQRDGCSRFGNTSGPRRRGCLRRCLWWDRLASQQRVRRPQPRKGLFTGTPSANRLPAEQAGASAPGCPAVLSPGILPAGSSDVPHSSVQSPTLRRNDGRSGRMAHVVGRAAPCSYVGTQLQAKLDHRG